MPIAIEINVPAICIPACSPYVLSNATGLKFSAKISALKGED